MDGARSGREKHKPGGLGHLLIATLLLAGCGYIGPPQAPSLAIPESVTDLTAAERGDAILAQFTIPAMTTQGLPLNRIRAVDLRVGVTPNPWNAGAWAAAAKPFAVAASGPGPLQKEIQIESDWIGKEVTIAVRATGPKGKTSDWSNLRQLTIAPPLATPADFKAVNAPLGVQLSWRASAPHYHVFRAAADAEPDLLTDTDQTQWLDSPVEYGTPYRYYVQGYSGELQQSNVAGPEKITPEDIFAPSVPAGLTAEQGTNAIELSWERNTEPRFQGYNVFRSVNGGPFQKVASLIAAPTYSDRDVQAGKKYRYEVSAVATNGRESARSAPFEITAQ
ncbi:MAG TPA: hypothetical protein VMB85_26945 [Bryobacteraceae bacterium]|nr:hypothetical protein [Bryobacteraceae bacterium]